MSMRTVIQGDQPFLEPRPSRRATAAFGRRPLLQGSSSLVLGAAVGIPILLAPRPGMANAAWVSVLTAAATALFNFIFNNDGAIARAFDRWINGTPVQARAAPTTVHDQHTYQVEFDGRSDFYGAGNRGAFAGIDRLPQLTVAQVGTTGHDLNWAEINNIILPRQGVPAPEIRGAELIRGYVGVRRPFVARDEPHFYRTVQQAAMSDTSLPRARLDVAYVRDVCTCDGQAAIGYAFRDAQGGNPLDTHFRLYRT